VQGREVASLEQIRIHAVTSWPAEAKQWANDDADVAFVAGKQDFHKQRAQSDNLLKIDYKILIQLDLFVRPSINCQRFTAVA